MSLRGTPPSCVQVAFFNAAMARAWEEQARLRAQLREQKARGRGLAHSAAPVHSKPEEEAVVPKSADDFASEESSQALHGAMEKLQVSLSVGTGRVGASQGS